MPVEPSDAAGIGDFPSAACTRKALKKRVDFISLLMGAVNVIGSKTIKEVCRITFAKRAPDLDRMTTYSETIHGSCDGFAGGKN